MNSLAVRATKIVTIGAGRIGRAIVQRLERSDPDSVELHLVDRQRDEHSKHRASKLRNSKLRNLKLRTDSPTTCPESRAGTSARASVASTIDVAAGADILVLAVPTPSLPRLLADLADTLRESTILVQVARGLDSRGRRLSELAVDRLGSKLAGYTLLAGGVQAEDLVLDAPSSATLAGEDPAVVARVGAVLVDAHLHLRRSTDLVGTEWAAAFGEVVAFLTGLARGSNLPTGTVAWLVSALSDELVALATRELDASPDTFAGHAGPWTRELLVAGLAESTSRRCGELLGRGFSIDDALEELACEGSEVEATVVLRALGARGVLELCPGLRALTDFAVGASNLAELWARLRNGA